MLDNKSINLEILQSKKKVNESYRIFHLLVVLSRPFSRKNNSVKGLRIFTHKNLSALNHVPYFFLNLSHQPGHETIFDIWEKTNITVSLDLNLIRLIHIEKRDIYMYKERHVTVSFGLSVKGRK